MGQRAQEIAEQIRGALGTAADISHVEAVKGYLNLYFDTAEYARRVVETVLEQKERFGAGPATGQRVMVEFSSRIHTRLFTLDTCVRPSWGMR